MKDIHEATPEELRAELARREEAEKMPVPQAKAPSAVDWSGVYKTVTSGIDRAIKEKYVVDDLQHYIYEAAVTAIYGDGYWSWHNKQAW